jgi:RNA polymerase sigma factor (sigma-70 family)
MTAKPSQTALYGELLTNEEAYSKDVGEHPRLSDEEEERLVAQARLGNKQARETLILDALSYVMKVAHKYARICGAHGRWRVEYLDLVQVGNVTLVECMDKALAHACPAGYLRRAALGEIVKYCMKHGSPIASPSQRGGHILPMKEVESLDKPLGPGNEEDAHTLADLLVATEPEKRSERDFSTLYQALAGLTEKQRYVVTHHYGLDGAPQDLFTLSCEMRAQAGKPFKDSANEAYDVCERALNRLRDLLSSPDGRCEVYTREEAREQLGVTKRNFETLVRRGAIPVSRQGLYPKLMIDALAEQRRTRGQQKREQVRAALAELARRGEPVSIHAVARLAGVNRGTVRTYVQQYQASALVGA